MTTNQKPLFVSPNEIQLSTHQIESAREVFKLFDENDTGRVSHERLIAVLKKFGQELTDEGLAAFLDEYDMKDAKSFSFHNYLNIIQHQFAGICTTLSQNPAFKDNFTPDEYKIILEFISIELYKENEEIKGVGEPARAAFVVLNGNVKISGTNEKDWILGGGTEHIVGKLSNPELANQSRSVIALSQVAVANFDLANLEMLKVRDSYLYRRLKEAFGVSLESNEEALTQYVAVVSHNNVKKVMVSFVEKHFDFFSKVPLVGTLSTGSILFQKLGIPLSKKVASGPLGGDQAIGALIEPGQLAAIFFFRDPLTAHPHQADIDALCRLCDVYQIPFATNANSAEALAVYLKENGLNYVKDNHAYGVMNQYIASQTNALGKL